MRLHIARPHFHVPFAIELMMLIGVLMLAAIAAHEVLGFILQELLIVSDKF
jgi:NAD/NADP transhydrogenase alpha subunit